MIVSVFGYNIAVGDADFRSPGLLRRPFCVCKDTYRAKVAVYLHSISQRVSSQCCHLLAVGQDCLSSIENCLRDVDELTPYVRGLGSLLPLCYGCGELMDLVLIHRFEVAIVHYL